MIKTKIRAFDKEKDMKGAVLCFNVCDPQRTC